MSYHIVIRRGTGPLHIAEAEYNHYNTLCGKKLTPGTSRIHTFAAGRPATAVWREWARCPGCETEDRRRR